MDPKRVPNPAIQNSTLKLPLVEPAFMVDQLPGKQEIEIMQHCYANRGVPFSKSDCRKNFCLILPTQGAAVQERQPNKFQLLCDAACAARKVLKEQEAKEMQKKKDSGVSSPEYVQVPAHTILSKSR